MATNSDNSFEKIRGFSYWQILRIFFPSLLTIALFALLAFAVFFPLVDHVIHKHEKDRIRELIYLVRHIIDHYHDLAVAGEYTQEAAQQRVIEVLKKVQHGDEHRDYFWVHDMTPQMIFHPHINNSNLSLYESANLPWASILESYLEAIQHGQGYVEYDWFWNGDPIRIERKISYVLHYEPWDWVISTGYFVGDAHEKTAIIRQNVTNVLIAVFAIVILISAYTMHQKWKHEKRNQIMQERLQQSMKLEAVGKLAGGIAHDFNNILTVIEGYADLALLRPELSESLRQDLSSIRQAADRAESITRQLLAFSRQQIISPRQIELNEIVQGMNRMLARIIGEDIELRIILDPNLKPILADPNQIEQILMNLAINARDAMPYGGQLTIETSNVLLTEKYIDRHYELEAGEYILLSVSDTGEGMDNSTQERIFEPFFTTKEPGKGTGLGLSTVYGIVKQNQGHISVYSEIGEGTTFKIYLPRAVESGVEETIHTIPIDSTPPIGSETVLLVEDDMEVLLLAKTTLDKYGYRVIDANCAQDAIRICESHPDEIHLMITDVVMPKLSGRQLVQKVKRFRPLMKILYMSGYTDNAIVHHGVLESNIWFIQKPLQPISLLVKVRQVLDAAPEESVQHSKT